MSDSNPARVKAEAEAAKREAHKRPGLANGKRWQAVHTSTRGWHVALVDDPRIVEFDARMKAREAFHAGDLRAFMEAASQSLMARVQASLSSDSDGPRMAETNEDSARGEAGPARAEGIAQPFPGDSHAS